MAYFDTVLYCRKEEFEPFRALIVLDDKALRRYVMCWSPILVQRLDSFPAGETLADLWACVKVDFQALEELTGDSTPQVMARFRQAQGLQLIYPDGSVATEVRSLLLSKLKEITGVDAE